MLDDGETVGTQSTNGNCLAVMPSLTQHDNLQRALTELDEQSVEFQWRQRPQVQACEAERPSSCRAGVSKYRYGDEVGW